MCGYRSVPENGRTCYLLFCEVLPWTCLRLSVCLSVGSHISKTTRPIFTQYSVHVTCVMARVRSDGNAILLYVLPVMWMKSCNGWNRTKSKTTRMNGMFRRVRQVAAPKSGAKSAVCIVFVKWRLLGWSISFSLGVLRGWSVIPRLALDIFYLRTKLGDSHFNRAGDMIVGV